MLALFFTLGASWEHLAHLAAFFVALGWFLWILDRSWVDFGGFREGLGRVLEVPGPHFSIFFARASFQCEKACDVQKPQFFLGFSRFLTCTRMAHELKKGQTIGPRAFRTQLPTKIVQKIRPGALWARFWRVLETFWASLWRVLGALGRLLVALRHLLGTSWAPLGHSWAPSG